jgi:ferredoxin
MLRRIIKIDEDKCDGCGLCTAACAEKALAIHDGKAKLLRDDYCDGLGNCLPACPADAISFEERETAAFNSAAVRRNADALADGSGRTESAPSVSSLKKRNWPLQLQLASADSSFFDGQPNLLVSADCAAYVCAGFRDRFMKDAVTLIACPKLDNADYGAKLADILRRHDFASITLVRMEVPCCGGLQNALSTALESAGRSVRAKCRVVTISTAGSVLGEEEL